MTDNEIITALKCCSTANCFDCRNCPYKGKTDDTALYRDCCNLLITDTLALINRQKTEIERLEAEKDKLIRTYKECMTEAVKEFAERLKQARKKIYPLYTIDLFAEVIDNLVKEFTEGGNGKT